MNRRALLAGAALALATTAGCLEEIHADATTLEPATYDLEVGATLEDGDRTDGHELTAMVEISDAESENE